MDVEKMERTAVKARVEFRRTKEAVERVLKEVERARNDDHYLILCVLQRQGEKITGEYDQQLKKTVIVWRIVDLKSLASFETITRCRREIQYNEGKYLPTDPEVAMKRRIRAETVREYYGGEK